MSAENPGGPLAMLQRPGSRSSPAAGAVPPSAERADPTWIPVAAHVRGGAGGDQGRERERPAASTSPPRPLARLLDQGFELGDPLLDSALVLDLGRTRMDRDRHDRFTDVAMCDGTNSMTL